MMTSAEALAAFQSISLLTGEMREAAQVGEWDRLAGLEQSCAAMVAKLREVPPARLPPDMQRQKVELIHKILADDAEIRTHTEPWMRRLQTLLEDTSMARRVHQTYDLGALKNL
ncbi:MAG TPA: flagellar protein FliT [Nitrosospira sp.]|nr:flagellar protein FliT [Nitrosospira sp.]